MSSLPTLSKLEHDQLTGMFNLGASRASASLSRMVKQEVLLSVPAVEFRSRKGMAKELDNDHPICSVSQAMDGPLFGESLLLFPAESGLKVVRHMLGNALSDEMVAELQQDALSEIGNIVLNACIGAIAEAMSESFTVGLPCFDISNPNDLLQINISTEDDTVLLTRIFMTLSESEVTGYLAFLLGNVSVGELQTILARMLNNLSTPA